MFLRDIYLTERAVRETGEFEFAGSHALGSRLQGEKAQPYNSTETSNLFTQAHSMSPLDDCDMELRSVLLFLGYRTPRASLERVP